MSIDSKFIPTDSLHTMKQQPIAGGGPNDQKVIGYVIYFLGEIQLSEKKS